MKFFDFNSENDFNLQEEYTKIDKSLSSPGDKKVTDAEDIINELGKKYVEGGSLDNYETLYANIETFLKKYRTDSKEVEMMTKEDRNKLFGYGITMYKGYEDIYKNIVFNFELSKEEWHFMDNVLNKKIKYNGQEIFNYWQLRVDFLEKLEKQFKSLPKEVESIVVSTEVQNLILLSHILMEHEENAGGNKSFYHFKNILFEVAQMTKLFNAYGVMAERLSNKFKQWIDALNGLDGYNDENERLNNIIIPDTEVKSDE